jgi:RNA polymerase sigma-70 factor (ECF subfamily)
VRQLQPDNSALTANAVTSEVWRPLWERLVSDERAATAVIDVGQLTAQMARGGEDAFREFYDRYFNRLLGYLLVLTRGHEDSAREALQSAMLRVVKHIRRFDSEETFWSWLTVLARTALVDQERKRNRYNAALERFAHEDASAAESRLLDCLRQSVSMLPKEDIVLIEKKYFEEQSVAQIASAMDTTEKAIESRLTRIRQKLKKQTLELLK